MHCQNSKSCVFELCSIGIYINFLYTRIFLNEVQKAVEFLRLRNIHHHIFLRVPNDIGAQHL